MESIEEILQLHEGFFIKKDYQNGLARDFITLICLPLVC